MTQKLEFVLLRVENSVGKGELDGHHHFLLSPQYFLKLSPEDHENQELFGIE